MTFSEFLSSECTYIFPAPGGSLADGSDRSSSDADLYLSEVASMIKKREMSRAEAIDTLLMKIDQIKNQIHYSVEDDIRLINRLGAWARELFN